MSLPRPFDPLLLLLDDPALLAVLLAGRDLDLDLAAAVAHSAVVAPAEPEPAPSPAIMPMPEDAFPTIAALDALLAASDQPEPGLDAAMRADLVEDLGLDPALAEDEAALLAALAALESRPPENLPELVSGEPLWVPAWVEAAREDWAVG